MSSTRVFQQLYYLQNVKPYPALTDDLEQLVDKTSHGSLLPFSFFQPFSFSLILVKAALLLAAAAVVVLKVTIMSAKVGLMRHT